MAQRPEDFNLPLSAIKRILLESMPSRVLITDGARLALSKAASIFILYLTTAANGFSQDNNRKRVLGKDVVEAMIDLDLGFLVPSLQAALSEHHRILLSKKQRKQAHFQYENSKVEDDIIVLDSDSDVAANSGSETSSADEGDPDDDDVGSDDSIEEIYIQT